MKKKDSYRSLFRRIVPKQVYHWGADLLNASQIIKTNGLQTYLQLYYPAQKQINEVEVIKLKNYSHPIYYRPNTSDINTLVQNLIREEYGQLPPGFQPVWIVDAGGYIGDVSLYFLNRFPHCRVLCLEPEPENYALAVRNLEDYGDRASVLQQGLWSHTTRLNMMGSFVKAQLTDSFEDGGAAIDVSSVETLMKTYCMEYVDILKLDVEGAEEHILSGNSEKWLPKVKSLIVEFHGDERRQKGIKFLHDNGFTSYQYRSLHYFLLNRLFDL
jgi:FkbM family methyltransferase